MRSSVRMRTSRRISTEQPRKQRVVVRQWPLRQRSTELLPSPPIRGAKPVVCCAQLELAVGLGQREMVTRLVHGLSSLNSARSSAVVLR